MSYVDQYIIDQLKGKLVSDLSQLGKIYKIKKSEYLTKSVDHSLVDDMLKEGWEEFGQQLKTKTKIRIRKSHNIQFEDDIWCQLYELGYRYLNYDQNFILPYGKEPEDKKQIDVIAIDDETVIIVECRSSEKPKKATSLKTEFEGLERRLDGFRKVIEQAFQKKLKLKYIFATRNLRIDVDGIDIQRLIKTNSFYYNDNTYEYLNSLIKSYKGAARYQFLGLLFKDQLISSNRIEVPAIEGDMGGKRYYMFSLEPHLLLKMGFVLHRTKANESEMPTYQRLLVPSRLKGISKFVEDGGYFPNSIILNFAEKKHKVEFQGSSRGDDTRSRYGILKIPNAFAIAYIIDGQHRVYGYANTPYIESNTIPVVAFTDLDHNEQLEIFMDINQNQKAVSPSLRLTLEEDLFWDSDRADSRIKALRSSIIKDLSESINGPLYNKITIGEDSAQLKFTPFANALMKSSLLPSAKGNKYDQDSVEACLYDISNQNHNNEMNRTKKAIVQFINLCYEYVEESYPEIFERDEYFILSNRGTFAFICLIGSLNDFETKKGNLRKFSTPVERFNIIQKYLDALFSEIKGLNAEAEEDLLTYYGTGAETRWLRSFQFFINRRFNEYEPEELIDYKERQDDELQDEGRRYGVAIEKYMKKVVLNNIKVLFGENWELEINSIKRECQDRAEKEMEKLYKEGLGKKNIEWTEMFNINDYKTIIERYWAKVPEVIDGNYQTFEKIFTIDIGEGIGSKKKAIKWISYFNSYRNLWAHEGTKEKRLNREEVGFLRKIYVNFYSE